jgi:nucleolar protein 58
MIRKSRMSMPKKTNHTKKWTISEPNITKNSINGKTKKICSDTSSMSKKKLITRKNAKNKMTEEKRKKSKDKPNKKKSLRTDKKKDKKESSKTRKEKNDKKKEKSNSKLKKMLSLTETPTGEQLNSANS